MSLRLISRQVDYAVNALCYLASNDSFGRVSDLQRILGMPMSFMRETMRMLGKAGVLHSCRGKKGGFTLAIPPEKINVSMLMGIFHDAYEEDHCMLKKWECQRKKSCGLRRELIAIEKVVRGRLENVTIASLMTGC